MVRHLSNPKLPINIGHDLLFRKLDCAVINHIHASLKQVALQAYDTARGVFIKGVACTRIQVSNTRLMVLHISHSGQNDRHPPEQFNSRER
jgi:hypothetical protein